jgi:hypothetical protein
MSEENKNEISEAYIKEIGHIGVSFKDTSTYRVGDDVDKFLEDGMSIKTLNYIHSLKETPKEALSVKVFKELAIKKEENEKVFFWIKPNPKVKKMKKEQLKGKSIEECILRCNIEKSLTSQHYNPKEKKTTVLSDEVDDCPTDIPNGTNLSKVFDSEINERIDITPEIESQLINNLKKPLDSYTQAQLINVSSSTTKFGKISVNEDANTYMVKNLSRLSTRNFGAIGDFNVDSIPLSVVRCKGTTVTWADTNGKEYQGLQLISRRFICKVAQFWGYIIDLGGNTKTANYRRTLELWGLTVENHDLDKEYLMVNGEMVISMIKDLLFLIRNQEVNPDKISLNLYNIIRGKSYQEKKDFNTILSEMKNRLTYTNQLGEEAWGYSKIHPDYLVCLLKELRSGEFDTSIFVPVILNLYKYPIECKDTQVRKMTEIQHHKHLDDYDIGKYIFERE